MSSPDDGSAPAELLRLIEVMRRLRDPAHGCPWDLEQDFASIAPYTIEEAYEVADAIERGDMGALREELGDLLLQVVYHAQMAEEAGLFGFADVAAGIALKMIRRHPHVFGDALVAGSREQSRRWEEAKAAERAGRAPDAASLMDDVPRALPALTRALKLQRRAARAGFDWPAAAPVLAKLREEVAELEAAQAADDPAGRVEEMGDLLFTVVNLARHLGIDPEAALAAGNRKFERRFRAIERALAAEGRRPAEAGPAELEAMWERAKVGERDGS